jgi:hypothetical protein
MLASLLGLVGLGAVARAQEVTSCALSDGSTLVIRRLEARELRRRRRCARKFLRQLQAEV